MSRQELFYLQHNGAIHYKELTICDEYKLGAERNLGAEHYGAEHTSSHINNIQGEFNAAF